MEKEQFETLRDLILEVFELAAKNVEDRARDKHLHVVEDDIKQDLLEEFSILRFQHTPDKEALIGLMIAEGLLPTDTDTEDFFQHIFDMLKGDNKSHAHSNATLALRLLSDAHEKQLGGPDVKPN